MSKNEWKKLVGVAGRLLLANLLVFSQSLWAIQDQQAKGKKVSVEKAAPQQLTESTAVKEKPSRGSHEGITVHGHWPSQPNSCSSTKSVMFTTPPFPLPPKTSQTVSFPFKVPTSGICPGTYTVTAATLVNGVAVNTSTATLTITAH